MTSLDGLNDDFRDMVLALCDAGFLGREALIANKRASGRGTDLDDVKRLERPPER